MQPSTRAPLQQSSGGYLPRKTIIFFALMPTLVIGSLIVLRLFGLVRPFSVPTSAMAPTISAGDHIVMEGATFLSRQPRRGDIVVFRTDGIPSVPPGTFYVKRVVGEPGERVHFAGGKLFVNDKQVSLSNAMGEIVFELPQGVATLFPQTEMTVPSDDYFVVGDNSTNSSDSRYWGPLPRKNIIGRVSFCYWPPGRIGTVK
jgi:signal peptidase I